MTFEVSDLVQNFFKYLIGGPDSRKWDLESRKRRIKTISQDVVFSTTSEIKKPLRHLQLELAIRSLTGSRKVTEILNRMCHCVSYSSVEKLENELTFKVNKNSEETSFRMETTPEFNTGIVWDNFDCFVETKSGKDTLHDTVRIAYQMRDVPMTNLTTLSTNDQLNSYPLEKSTSCTHSLPLSQQPCIRQKQQLPEKNRDWLLLLMEQVKTRTAGNIDVRMNQQG